jgi:uncharacterized membrane protein
MLPNIGSFQGPGGRFEGILSLLFILFATVRIKMIRLTRMGNHKKLLGKDSVVG